MSLTNPVKMRSKRQDLLLALILSLLFGTLATLLGQDMNWDLRSYHFYNGFALLHHRIGWDFAPATEQSFLNPFFDLINYLIISTGQPLAVSFLLGIFSGLNCFLLYKLALILFKDLPKEQQPFYTLLAVLIGVTGSLGLGLVGTTTNDSKMTLLILCSLYCLMKALYDSEKPLSLIFCSGLAMGLAVGFKLVAACYGLGLIFSLLTLRSWQRANLIQVALLGLSMGLGFLIADGYWLYFIYSQFKNPFFPYYNNLFHSPYAAAASFSDLNYYPQHYLTLPFILAKYNKLISDVPIRELRFALLYSLSILLILFRQLKLKGPLRLLAFFFLSSYLIWFFEFTIYRYLLPLELLSGLLIVAFLKQLLPADKLCKAILTLCALTLIFTTHPFSWDRTESGRAYFELQPPRLPSNATIILTSTPLAYTIPFFQEDLHFIGMPFFLHSAKLAKVKNYIMQKSNAPLEREAAEELIHKSQGKLYSLSLARNSLTLRHLDSHFKANFTLTRTSTIEPWRLYRDTQHGHGIIMEVYNLGEIPGLEEEVARFPAHKLSSELSLQEQQTIEKLIRNYEESTPFKDDYSAPERALYYQYGLIRDDKHCLYFSSSVDANLELCPLISLRSA